MAGDGADARLGTLGDVNTRFFGELQARRQWQDAFLMSFRHPRPRRVPKHQHPLPHFTLILQGNYEEVSRTGSLQYQGFTAAFHPAFTEHSGVLPDGGVSCFSVEIGEEWLQDLSRHSLDRPIYELQAGEITWLAVKLFREYCAGADANDLAIESLLWEMLGVAARLQCREQHDGPAWWSRALNLLHDRFREAVRIRDLADEVGVHPVYFARAFRRMTGKNAGAYLQNLRIQHACRGLSNRELPLCEIAAEAGFADQSHMTRMFRRMVGVTPAEMRRALGEKH